MEKIPLEGSWSDYTNGLHDAPIARGQWNSHPDGRQDFVIYADSDQGKWSLHLHKRGDEFIGSWAYEGMRDEYSVTMRLYRATHDDKEWLLLGTWRQPDGATTHGSLSLWPA